ncbi:MAG: hypothetical protein CMP23_02640 [Rickettsiales bacterium]|nr:hypothetical protein [Rickettsiales bacterium]
MLLGLAVGLSGFAAVPGEGLSAPHYSFVENQVESFRFQLERRVKTGGELDLAPFMTRLEGRVQRYLARVFRDGSFGFVTRVVELSGTESFNNEAAQALDLGGLDGRSISLRLARTGELLDSVAWSYLRTAGGGDLVDGTLLASLPRLPERLPAAGEELPQSYRLSFDYGAGVRCDQLWVLVYRLGAGFSGSCGVGCMPLAYRAELSERCADRSGGDERTATGVVEGELEFKRRRAGLELRAHRWDRRLQRSLPVADRSSGASVLQELDSRGTLIAEGGAP